MTEQQPGAPQGAITEAGEAGEAGEPCDFRCGYVSTGLDLWLHVFHEHARCPECGNEPFDGYAVSHKQDCLRLQPGYVYPGPVPAEFEDQGNDDEEPF